MEEKTPHIEGTKWYEEKGDEDETSIKGFISFETNLINIEETVQFLRKQGKLNDINKPEVENINSYITSRKH